MTELLVARHGETDWNAEHRWLGQVDRPLSEKGREQAKELARRLDGVAIDAAYASDLSRAGETATIALAGRGLAVERRPGLRERFLGSWQGMLEDDIARRFPDAYAAWKSGASPGAPDAEPFAEFSRRVLDAVLAVAAENPSRRVLVVAHSGPLRALAASAAGLDYATARASLPEPPHCVPVRYFVDAGRLRRAE